MTADTTKPLFIGIGDAKYLRAQLVEYTADRQLRYWIPDVTFASDAELQYFKEFCRSSHVLMCEFAQDTAALGELVPGSSSMFQSKKYPIDEMAVGVKMALVILYCTTDTFNWTTLTVRNTLPVPSVLLTDEYPLPSVDVIEFGLGFAETRGG
jgi:hypothetical protein